MQKILIDGTETTEKVVNIDDSKVEVIFNEEKFQIYGTNNEILIFQNNRNLRIYGDDNSISIKGNESNLHIYGDFNKVLVKNNNSNLHIYGTHNDVVIEKGEAVTYGYYGSTTIFDEAQANVYGNYKNFNQA